MKNAVAIAALLAGLVIAVPAFAADGLAPGSLQPAAPERAPAEAPDSAATAADDANAGCTNCPPPRRYDSQEVVRTRQDNNYKLKTVNTYEMAQPRTVEQPGIRVRSDVTLVNFVVHRYRVIYAPALVSASDSQESYAPRPAVYHPRRDCRYGRYGGHCRPLRVRG